MYLTNSQPGNEPVIAEGMTASQWVGLLNTPRAQWAAKSLNYLDGLQLEELQKLLARTEKKILKRCKNEYL